MLQKSKLRNARHRKERKDRNKHKWGISLVPSWLFSEKNCKGITMPITTSPSTIVGDASDISTISGSSFNDMAENVTLTNAISRKAWNRLRSKLFPEWDEYKIVWELLKAVQLKRAKMDGLSEREQKSSLLSIQEQRLRLQMLDIQQARRIQDIQDNYNAVALHNGSDHTQDKVPIVDKAMTLVLGERAKDANIDLEWDEDMPSSDHEARAETVVGSAHAPNLSVLFAKQVLEGRLGYEFMLYTKNQAVMQNFAQDANLSEKEAGTWAAATQNSAYFQENDFTSEVAVKKSDAYIQRRITKLFDLELGSTRFDPDAMSFKGMNDFEFCMRELTTAQDEKNLGILEDKGDVAMIASQQVPGVKESKRNTIRTESDSLLTEVNSSIKKLPRTDQLQSDAEKACCIVCGLDECEPDCWGHVPRVSQFNVDKNFFVAGSLISSTGELVSDICTTCGKIGCGLFCDNPSSPSLSSPYNFNPPEIARNHVRNNTVKSRPEMLCTHCKKAGHMKHHCWRAHPELIPAKFEKPCGVCGRLFHSEEKCFMARHSNAAKRPQKASVRKQTTKSEWAKTFDQNWKLSGS